MNYSFIKQINASNQKEAVKLCQKYEAQNGIGLIDVSENPKWFEAGADLIEETPNELILIDVKCDERMGETGNVAVELIEISSLNGFIKKGWAYKNLHYIYYVDWKNKINYKLKLGQLLQETFAKSRYGFSAYHPQEKYFTLGVLVPVKELTSERAQLT